MTMDANDPRITAYALGELDEADREETERWLEEHPEAQQEVEQIQAMAGLLTEELAEEPEQELSEGQRDAVLQRLEVPATEEEQPEEEQIPGKRPWILRPAMAAVAMAATVLVAVGVGSFWFVQRSPMVPFAYTLEGQAGDSHAVPQRLAEAKMGTPADPQHGLYGVKGPGSTGRKITSSPQGAQVTVRPGVSNNITTGALVGTATYKEGWKEVDRDKDGRPGSGEQYIPVQETPFRLVARAPLSTFSIDVDTASYANVRRFLTHNSLPPPAAVRIEEMINYFSYDYAEPAGQHPFSVGVETGPAPWQPKHRLVRIGLRGKEVLKKRRPASNLVFLIDVSGSMSDLNKLPLLRRGMKLLVDQLTEKDRVAMVVYAGASGLVLPSTACTKQNLPKILSSLERLQAGGSTNGGAGIKLAYDVAVANFVKGGVNRVLLATDGDFNVGLSDRGALVKLIKQRAKSGVFLSVLGFGMGNLKDGTLEQLADKGNGNYAYIDTINEARKVLVEQMTGTLITIAKDVKIQVEFNPARAQAYRLIGYENRRLANRDFADDKKDAGEIGAGHTVTALYEVIPPGVKVPAKIALKYQQPAKVRSTNSKELLTVKLRYKQPDASVSKLLSVSARDPGAGLNKTSADFKFAAAVAWFGMALRRSERAGKAPHEAIVSLGRAGLGRDKNGRRAELIKLVRSAARLAAPK